MTAREARILEPIPAASAQFVSAASLRRRTDWFVKLRWGAAAAVILLSSGAALAARVPLPLPSLIGIGLLLLVLNLGYYWRNRRTEPVDIGAELALVRFQMVSDLVLLTAVLHFSGGVENPFQFIAVIHVIIASLLLKGRQVDHIAWLAGGLYTAMVLGEHFGILKHHHLLSASELSHELTYALMSIGAMWLVLLIGARVGSRIMVHNRAIKDELVERQAELTGAAEAQVDFFRFVTHEVKSPVVTAQSAVETALELGREEMPDASADMLDRAVKRLRQALTIVKDLADLTRGRMSGDLHREPVDLVAVVVAILDDQSPLIEAKGLTVSRDLPAAGLTISADASMVDKIVVNLVGNAVRYNREGRGLHVRLAREGGAARLSVRDEGIGIAAEDLDRIFEEFYRTAAAREASANGTGLGLPIVKRFVERLGGTIHVSSKPGTGTTFTVTLPVEAPAPRSDVEEMA